LTGIPEPGTELCALDELPANSGRVFTWGSGKTATGVIVLRDGDRVTAYVNRCPHFSIPLDSGTRVTVFEAYVLCSHHYAAFRMSDGYCVEGPCAGGALTPVAIAVTNGRIRLAERESGTHDPD
jgi:nitrite reductase/ring-hydroxylating ferredoxin subunit